MYDPYQDPYAPRQPQQQPQGQFSTPQFQQQGPDVADQLAQIQQIAPYLQDPYPHQQQQQQKQSSGSIGGLLSLFGG